MTGILPRLEAAAFWIARKIIFLEGGPLSMHRINLVTSTLRSQVWKTCNSW